MSRKSCAFGIHETETIRKATVTLFIVSCPSRYLSRMRAGGHYSLFITMNLIKNQTLPLWNIPVKYTHVTMKTYYVNDKQ